MTEKIENNLNLTLSERYNNYDWPKVPTEEEINLRNILINILNRLWTPNVNIYISYTV